MRHNEGLESARERVEFNYTVLVHQFFKEKNLKELIKRLDELGMNRLQEAIDNKREFLTHLNVQAELKKLDEMEQAINS